MVTNVEILYQCIDVQIYEADQLFVIGMEHDSEDLIEDVGGTFRYCIYRAVLNLLSISKFRRHCTADLPIYV